MKVWAAAAAAILGFAGGAGAGGLAPVTSVTAVPASSVGPALPRLEVVRYVGPQVGRDVVVPVNGAQVATIEWHSDVMVRVRTESGALLTPAELSVVQSQALTCERGEVRGPTTRLEPNGTYVIDYDCTRLQGLQ